MSPLYFSDGVVNGPNNTVIAQTAAYSNAIFMYDRDYSTVTGPVYPGATGGTTTISGGASFFPGFGVSLYDAHEIAKELFVGNTGQSYGEYGFGFTVTVPFDINGGTTYITSPVMVDVFAVSDPNLGDFADNAPILQQDMATLAIYNAIVPEPSSLVLAIAGVGLLAWFLISRRRRRDGCGHRATADSLGPVRCES